MSPIALAISSLCVTVLAASLFAYERTSGRRFFPHIRGFADRMCERARYSTLETVPEINHSFLRQLLHYVIHRILSHALRGIKLLERATRATLRINKQRAVVYTESATSSHLRKIAEHKEEVALSATEKKARKKAAIEGVPDGGQ